VTSVAIVQQKMYSKHGFKEGKSMQKKPLLRESEKKNK
jgi:hypothetical protein